MNNRSDMVEEMNLFTIIHKQMELAITLRFDSMSDKDQ
jgi:hypothetical protein